VDTAPQAVSRAALAMAGAVGIGLAAAAGCSAGSGSDSGGVVGAAEGTRVEASQALTSAQVCLSITRPTGGVGGVFDTQIKSDKPTTNFNGSQTMSVGVSGGAERQSLVQFDLSAIPPGPNTNITSATVNFAELTSLQNGTGSIELHRITAGWVEGQVTWQSFGGAFDPTVAATMSAAAPYPATSLQPLVQAWVRGTLPNDGVLLKQTGSLTTLFTSELGNPYQQPSLYVCYTLTCNPGFADCNGNGLDGCETDLGASAGNCGTCGHACSVPNAAPACTNGACGVGACNLGFGDCDGDAQNGSSPPTRTAAPAARPAPSPTAAPAAPRARARSPPATRAPTTATATPPTAASRRPAATAPIVRAPRAARAACARAASARRRCAPIRW
jgi:hypothetical protein